MKQVTIIGGGLAGLVSSILLARGGFSVTLIEKKEYPFHRVCGEYISNEVIPFLEKHNLFPTDLAPSSIHRLQLTSTTGRSFQSPLDLGGFGVSRYTYDFWLAEKAKAAGVNLLTGIGANSVTFLGNEFEVALSDGSIVSAPLVIIAHGKRSLLDKTLNRSFLLRRSPYVGVKYHVKANFPDDLIALHNFRGGYCGASQVEGGVTNLCYLVHREVIRTHGSVEKAERKVLWKNPYLRELFQQSEFLFEKPEVINEITFERKEAVYNHLLMAGDAAGMITPLCGNGMAMAIHSSKVVSEQIQRHWQSDTLEREALETSYSKAWGDQFAQRLWMGRKIQSLFGGAVTSSLAVAAGRYIPPVARSLIKLTHGEPFS